MEPASSLGFGRRELWLRYTALLFLDIFSLVGLHSSQYCKRGVGLFAHNLNFHFIFSKSVRLDISVASRKVPISAGVVAREQGTTVLTLNFSLSEDFLRQIIEMKGNFTLNVENLSGLSTSKLYLSLF